MVGVNPGSITLAETGPVYYKIFRILDSKEIEVQSTPDICSKYDAVCS
jgi:hypothetical protein